MNTKRVDTIITIKQQLKNISEAGKEVFRKPLYIAVASLLTLLLYAFNTTITNFKLLTNNFSITLLWNLVTGAAHAMTTLTLVLIAIMSILAGIVLALSVYIIKRQIQFNAGVGTTGFLASIIAPSCPSCAMGLLSVLGFGSFLSFLPFKGAELGIIGITILIISIGYLSNKIMTTICEMPANN